MKASASEQVGSSGLHEVMANFERIGWGPLENPTHDLGTDLFVQVRDDRKFDLGILVGVQVKSGASFFEREVRDGDRILGWEYYEPDVDHFNDWVRHTLPHLLVLHDLDTRTSYWVHVTPEATQITGKGCKILVPQHQAIADEGLEHLLRVATSTRSEILLEGTSWTASASGIAPAERLRYALLSPRLVAPHGNTPIDRDLEPEEALALLIQCRLFDLNRRLSRQLGTDSPFTELATHRDWRWKLVGAVLDWLADHSIQRLLDLREAAPNQSALAAATVASVCALVSEDRIEEAIALLSTEVFEIADFAPVDYAWLLAHRARLGMEVGDVGGGTADAVEAQRTIGPHVSDPTASVIGAAAAWTLFTAAGWESRRLEDVIPHLDTAASWWRTQLTSGALEALADRVFRAWAADTSTTIAAEDKVNNGLLAARLSADLAAEHGSWRAHASLLARHTVADTHRKEDADGLADALGELRLCGDDKSLKLAAQRIWQIGPLKSLQVAAQKIGEASWHHTPGKSNLTLLEIGGDLLNADEADDALEICLAAFDADKQLLSKLRPTFLITHEAARALRGILPSASVTLQRSATLHVASRAAGCDDLLAQDLASIVGIVASDVLTKDDGERLFEISSEVDHKGLRAALLGLANQAGSLAARRRLVELAQAGDRDAVAQIGDRNQVDEAMAANLIEDGATSADRIRENAAKGQYGFGGPDLPRMAALLNIWFPQIAQWGSLIDLLLSPDVMPLSKRGICRLLAANASDLPVDVGEKLGQGLALIGDCRRATGAFGMGFDESLEGADTELGIAIGAITGEIRDVAIAKLVAGESTDRVGAARILGRTTEPALYRILGGLLQDPDLTVRRSAAVAVGRLLPEHEDDHLLRTFASELVLADGVAMPHALLSGLASAPGGYASRSLAQTFSTHPSAVIRRSAGALGDAPA